MDGKTVGARVGVLLSGCGAYDGSDLHEAVLTLLAVGRRGARSVCIAPDIRQLDVVDHLSGLGREDAVRSVREESARIARGKLEAPTPSVYGGLDALVVIGGFGVAKNLMQNFALPGAARSIEPSVLEMLAGLRSSGKPLGAVGLGKALLSTLLGEELFEGTEAGPADRAAIDEERRLYCAPGFLGVGGLPEVAAGIEAMVEAMLRRNPALRIVK